MNLAWIIANQIGTMFLLMLVGYLLFKSKRLTKNGTKEMGSLILYVVLPVLIVNHFNQPFTEERFHQLWISALIALISLGVSMSVAHFSLGKTQGIARFSVAFSNAGFFGIPIVQAVWGDEAVFYIIFTIAFLNIFQWLYGVFVMTRSTATIHIKQLVKNPIIIGTLVGLILFHLPITLPTVVEKGMGFIASLNTPLGMLILGVYLAETSFKELLTSWRVYRVVLLRLVVVPLCLMGVFSLLPTSWSAIYKVIFVVSATPVGSNVAIMAQQYQCDTKEAIQYIVMSTLCSIITLPIFAYFFI